MLDDRLKLYTPKEVREMLASDRRLYGTPYPFPHPRAKITADDDGKMKGLITEHAVANLLNLLIFDYKDLYVFHSIGNYGDEDGETDNILIYQNTLVIIEAKSLSNFDSVSIDIDGKMYGRRGKKRIALGGHNNLVKKVAAYRERYPFMKVYGFYVVRQAQKTGSSYSGLYVSTLEKILNEVSLVLDNAKTATSSTAVLLKETMDHCIRHEVVN